jgi:hypothetical protein
MLFSKTIISLVIILFLTGVNTKGSCPKYQCDKGTPNSCATVKADLVYNSVTSTDQCSKDQYCNIPYPYWDQLANLQSDPTFNCKNNYQAHKTRNPGEHCDTYISTATRPITPQANALKEYVQVKKKGEACELHATCWGKDSTVTERKSNVLSKQPMKAIVTFLMNVRVSTFAIITDATLNLTLEKSAAIQTKMTGGPLYGVKMITNAQCLSKKHLQKELWRQMQVYSW